MNFSNAFPTGLMVVILTSFALTGFASTSFTPPPALKWQKMAPGVWRASVGKRENLTLLSAAEAEPNQEALVRMPKADAPPLDLGQTSGEMVESYAMARIPLQREEKLFGMGLQMHGSNRREGIYHLQMDHYSKGVDRLHAPTPLYISSLGYAVFFNTARPCSIYAGVGNRLGDPNNPPARDRTTDPNWEAQPYSPSVEASVQAPGLEVYLFAGPTPMDAMRRTRCTAEAVHCHLGGRSDSGIACHWLPQRKTC